MLNFVNVIRILFSALKNGAISSRQNILDL